MASGGGRPWRALPVGEIQRERILRSVIAVVADRGVAGASIRQVCVRAEVSRRMFYECFGGLDGCLMTVLDSALERAAAIVVRAFGRENSWQGGMRLALAAMLGLFDEEPALARVCLVEMQAAAPGVRAHRERVLEEFRALVVGLIGRDISHPSPLAAESAHASVIGIVNARLIGREQKPLIQLLGPLMGVIVGPFMDKARVAEEIERGNALAQEILERHVPSTPDPPEVRVPDVLLSARAHRARLCLLYVAEHANVSNKRVGEGIGVSHRGQVARLLGRLADLDLVVKRPGSPGHANAWSLTEKGEQVARSLVARPC